MLPLREQSRHKSDGNEGVLFIPQNSPSDCLVSKPGQSVGESYPSTEMQSMYSAVPADWANNELECTLSDIRAMVLSILSYSNNSSNLPIMPEW